MYTSFVVSGEVVLLPSGVVLACVGVPLEITCNTTSSSLQWNITYARDTGETASEIRFVYHSTLAPTLTSFMIHQSTLNFTRTSKRRAIPLTATLLIDRVTEDINQTTINCMQLGSSVDTAATVIITVIDQNYSK
ncbi:MAG: hypothetical protein MJE68_02975 [Proteobacteria bacterium]|nr:hypothetical protein [Pseudomonadota bacterium]